MLNRRSTWIVVGALLLGATLWLPPVRCSLFYEECRAPAAFEAREVRGWSIPVNAAERRAYDYAHALPTPAQAPPTVPFDFKAARIRELWGGLTVGEQYMLHLCDTEATELVLRRVKDVDGFRLLRPRPATMDTEADFDLYGTEEPVGFGDGDGYQRDLSDKMVGETYVQPLSGVYTFVEFADRRHPGRFVRVDRADHPDLLHHPHGTDSGWKMGRAPYVHQIRDDVEGSARYAYTWRGLRRAHDRDYGIAGGEVFVVDMATNEVLGYRRSFKITRTDKPRWTFSKRCDTEFASLPTNSLVERVLNPRLHVNDAFVPAPDLPEYHAFLANLMERGYAQKK